MKLKINNKSAWIFPSAIALLGSCAPAQAEVTEKEVAFRVGANGSYITTAARGALNTSGKEIGSNQKFVLIDLNGGELAEGDSVQIKWAPEGSRPTWWNEGEGSVHRIGGKPGAGCEFKVKLKEKAAKDGPQPVVLQTASGKFVSTESAENGLTTVEAEDKAATLEIVNVAADAPAAATTSTTTTTSPTTTTNVPAPAPAAAAPIPTRLQKTEWKFDFGSGAVAPGYTPVLPTSTNVAETGFGLESGAQITAENRGQPDALKGDFLTSDKPFLFHVAVPEGNYNVTVTLGDQAGASSTTIKAEQRRLVLENVQTKTGEFATRTFTVNVSTPPIAGNPKPVALRSWSPMPLNWDEKLTLEFNGPRPTVCALEITKAENALTVFLAGDSTVTDQGGEPWAAWGQMLPRFFKPGVAVANYAESGLTLSTFRGQRRLDKILSAIKPGDYVFIQFGHNDQKDRFEGAGPFTSYKSNLKDYVTQVKGKGGLPVIVTPMERRRWNAEGKPEATLGDFAEAARQAAREEGVPLIDLNAMSLKFYEALGPEGSKRAFVHYPANTFPGQSGPLRDDTHFNNYGAYELARGVVEGIKANVPELAKRLADDVKPYDPAQPDAAESFGLPVSPFPIANEKPAGS